MKVVVAEPSRLLRTVLRRLLERADEIEVVACVESSVELTAQCRQGRPQVVVAATSFPDADLIESIAEILLNAARVLVVAQAIDTEAVTKLLLAGASGCLLVDDSRSLDVVAAVREVAAGRAALHPAAAAVVLRQWRAVRSADPAVPAVSLPRLTPREDEVLQALARGLTTKAIGRELAVSPKTVEAHVARLLAKLGARNRAHAVSVAAEMGLLGCAAAP